MSNYDEQYLDLVDRILKNGYYDNNRTGIPTYKLPHQMMQFDLEKEFPIATTKFVAFRTAVRELLWIFKDQSNDVTKLQKRLDELGYFDQDATGFYGPYTAAAVKAFQKRNSLTADGIAGPKTLDKVYRKVGFVKQPRL